MMADAGHQFTCTRCWLAFMVMVAKDDANNEVGFCPACGHHHLLSVEVNEEFSGAIL